MTKIVATNITSPLGLTTEENYSSVRRGGTALRIVEKCLGLPESFCVGIFPDDRRRALKLDGYSWYESLVLHSVKEALSHTSIDHTSPRTILILGTSTASVEELGEIPEKDGDFRSHGVAARKIAESLGFTTVPITVSNACISGGAAQLLADRLISSGYYDVAVVCGADVLSAFVLAGFSAFKALSPSACRPFDIERMGLNIGECAATVVMTKAGDGHQDGWYLIDGSLNNDAYHVSAPIPSGDGLCRTIKKILTPWLKESLACVTAHGSATMFNDQMESKAIENAGLGDIFTTAYKPHFGHTFGASGIVEPVITMCSLDEGKILPLHGFEETGVSGRIKVCTSIESTDKRAFIKTQSGFGGGNCSIIYSRNPVSQKKPFLPEYQPLGEVRITPCEVVLNGKSLPVESSGSHLITEIYKSYLSDGSRFYKMDLYSRLAYVATGLLCKDSMGNCSPEDISLYFFTQNGSVLADRKHLSTFSAPGEYYPSPAIMINTLPNVVLGEIAVRNDIKGETALVMLPCRDNSIMDMVVKASVSDTHPALVICGWVDCDAEDSFTANLKMLKIK